MNAAGFARVDNEVAIVMLTALTDSRTALAAFAAGAHDYIRKPFVVSELLAQIRAHLADERRVA